LFQRPDRTYDLDRLLPARIATDPLSPLHQAVRLIPEGSRVLDVGAGNGLLAHVLALRRAAFVIDGIEPNPRAAEIAAPYYRKFHVGFAEEFGDEIRAENYDVLVLADVIEHTVDPVSFLRNLAALAPSARLIVSIPNVAFAAVRMALLEGRFDYVDSGLLERTHLRFFTLATVERVFDSAGLAIERRIFLKRNAFETEIDAAPGSLLDVATLLRMRSDALSATYQFQFVLARSGGITVDETYGRGTSAGSILHAYARRHVLGRRRTSLRD
jgi:2-polyprenyl-3-methyl-5-hydroxy-6-metoxy-1,4-benzoquinol methylase